MPKMERVESDGKLVAMIFSGSENYDETTFHTEDDLILQFGHISIDLEKPVRNHFHNPIKRRTVGTAEVLILQKGKVEVSLFNDELVQIHQSVLETGDVICLYSGGHGFTAVEPSTLLEIKNGPYTESVDKVYF